MIGVLDTNVLVAANGQLSPEDPICELAAVEIIQRVRDNGCFGIDDNKLIIEEYTRNLDRSKPIKVGAQLLFELFNLQRVKLYQITPDATRGFAEFPSDGSLANFHKNDRKFVAVALTAGNKHILAVATDSGFWQHKQALADNGVTLEFICKHRFE
jgi:hypothetical protein